eukprot:scaffold1298_cov382-Prasinococcus_capsulatus_cf.AAC.22
MRSQRACERDRAGLATQAGPRSSEAAAQPLFLPSRPYHARVVEQVAGGGVVRGVHHHVVLTDESQSVARRHAVWVDPHAQVGVERAAGALRRQHLGMPHRCLLVDDLPVQVVQRHCVRVRQPQHADACRGLRAATAAATVGARVSARRRPSEAGGRRRTRYSAAGEPRPPTPTTSAREDSNLACRSGPKEGTSTCRLKRSTCAGVSPCSHLVRCAPLPARREWGGRGAAQGFRLLAILFRGWPNQLRAGHVPRTNGPTAPSASSASGVAAARAVAVGATPGWRSSCACSAASRSRRWAFSRRSAASAPSRSRCSGAAMPRARRPRRRRLLQAQSRRNALARRARRSAVLCTHRCQRTRLQPPAPPALLPGVGRSATPPLQYCYCYYSSSAW